MNTRHRRALVAAIGGEGQFEASTAFGRAVTRQGWILLTGGQVVSGRVARAKGEVKEGAMLGALEEPSGQARLIGILPSSSVHWDHAPGSRHLFLHTGLPHNVRNVINGRTPDAIVAFGGSRGTLAEIAFAKASRKPVIFARNSLHMLRLKLEEHFGDRNAREDNVKSFFEEPLKTYPDAAGAAGNGSGLFSTLEPILDRASEETDTAAALQAILNELDIAEKPTGFPGLPGNEETHRRFETIVAEISQ